MKKVNSQKIIFLEGLPGVGKTTILNRIKSLNYDIVCSDEIINSKILGNSKKLTQKDFMKNDDYKLRQNAKYLVVDRGPISTYSYCLAKYLIDNNYNFSVGKIKKWFAQYIPLLNSDNVFVFYLTNIKQHIHLPYINENDPYGSNKNQKLLENIALFNCEKYVKNLIVKNYNKENCEEVINEIINKLMCS